MQCSGSSAAHAAGATSAAVPAYAPLLACVRMQARVCCAGALLARASPDPARAAGCTRVCMPASTSSVHALPLHSVPAPRRGPSTHQHGSVPLVIQAVGASAAVSLTGPIVFTSSVISQVATPYTKSTLKVKDVSTNSVRLIMEAYDLETCGAGAGLGGGPRWRTLVAGGCVATFTRLLTGGICWAAERVGRRARTPGCPCPACPRPPNPDCPSPAGRS